PEVLAEQIIKRALSVRQIETLVAKAIAGRGAERRPSTKQPDLVDLERQVSEAIGCRVSITTTRKGGGELSVQFRDSLQLEDLVNRLIRKPEPMTAEE
ncbi:MAG TPA: chromosome partitioning protein ParB, partial [Rhodopila sp.]|nr:chromosome partitioning protein ParB [Rhodopila sp.]